jgi:hypothetical protein
MSRDLSKAFETDNGLIVGGVVLPDSIVDKTRSSKPTYSGDVITSIEFYNSLIQVTGNRVAKADFTYYGDYIATQINTYYEPDGVTVFNTESLAYTYSGDVVSKVEVS